MSSSTALALCVHHKPWLAMSTVMTALLQNDQDFDIQFLHNLGDGVVHKDAYQRFDELARDAGENSHLSAYDADVRAVCELRSPRVSHVEYENDHTLDSGAFYKFIRDRRWTPYPHVLFAGEGTLFARPGTLSALRRLSVEHGAEFIASGHEQRCLPKAAMLHYHGRHGATSPMDLFHDEMIGETFAVFCRDPEFRALFKAWSSEIAGETQHHVPAIPPSGTIGRRLRAGLVQRGGSADDESRRWWRRAAAGAPGRLDEMLSAACIATHRESHWPSRPHRSDGAASWVTIDGVEFHRVVEPHWFGCTPVLFMSRALLTRLTDRMERFGMFDVLDLPFAATALEIVWGFLPAWLGVDKWFTDGFHRVRKDFTTHRREDFAPDIASYVNRYHRGRISVRSEGRYLKLRRVKPALAPLRDLLPSAFLMAVRRLGFYMPRPNYQKVMGPLIDYVGRQRSGDYRAVILLPRWGSAKAGSRVDVAAIAGIGDGQTDIRELDHPDDLLRLVRDGQLDALLSVQPALSDLTAEEFARLRSASVAQGTKWVALPEGFSQDAYLTTESEAILANWDLVCLVGPRSMAFLEQVFAEMDPGVVKRLRERIAIVGYPEFDALPQLGSHAEIRGKYGLPTDKPLVFVATAPRIVPLSVNSWRARGIDARFRESRDWRSRVFAVATRAEYPAVIAYRRYLEAMRQFADRNGAALVAKTRAKHGDPACLTDAVDRLVDDRTFYPFTTLELMKCSSLYVGFYSNTVSEAVASGVYAWTALHMPPAVAQWRPEWRRLSRFMLWGAEGLWRRRGVASTINGVSRQGGADLDRFAASSLDEHRVDRESQVMAMREFFGYPSNSSARLLEALAARWN